MSVRAEGHGVIERGIGLQWGSSPGGLRLWFLSDVGALGVAEVLLGALSWR